MIITHLIIFCPQFICTLRALREINENCMFGTLMQGTLREIDDCMFNPLIAILYRYSEHSKIGKIIDKCTNVVFITHS